MREVIRLMREVIRLETQLMRWVIRSGMVIMMRLRQVVSLSQRFNIRNV